MMGTAIAAARAPLDMPDPPEELVGEVDGELLLDVAAVEGAREDDDVEELVEELEEDELVVAAAA